MTYNSTLPGTSATKYSAGLIKADHNAHIVTQFGNFHTFHTLHSLATVSRAIAS